MLLTDQRAGATLPTAQPRIWPCLDANVSRDLMGFNTDLEPGMHHDSDRLDLVKPFLREPLNRYFTK